MEKSFFFDAVVTDGVPDRSYSAADIAAREACIISDGVIGGASLAVRGLSSAGVYVGKGAASVAGYTYLNDEELFIPIEAGDGTYDRIDSVVLKLDLGGRSITATVVKGRPLATPAAPTLPKGNTVKYLLLANVLVRANARNFDESCITDKRVLAGYASVKEDMKKLLGEYIGELDSVTAGEVRELRRVIGIVSDNEGKNTVLCGDGVYREPPSPVREVAAEYTASGEYTFIPAEHPSKGDVYDIEVQGAGGAGGSYNGVGIRGGGGGGGAFVSVGGVRLYRDTCKVTVGAGGVGVLGGSGGDGGYSSFEGFIADGGAGGGGGISAAGGAGGVGMFCGERGADGKPDAGGMLSSQSGRGGYSYYGNGAEAPLGEGSVQGNDAEVTGAGGSGGSSAAGAYDKSGGKGGDGRVTVYRYTMGQSEGA